MTREHDSRHRNPADMYAHARCDNCPHLVYPDDPPAPRRCRWNYAGTCPCTDHMTVIERAAAADPTHHAALPEAMPGEVVRLDTKEQVAEAHGSDAA